MLIDSELAYQNLQFENEIKLDDELMFRYNKHEQDTIFSQKPWNKDPNYFQNVKISTQALIKMLTHAKEGGNIEVMGIMQGKVIGRELIVVDAFALPVEGTETRVNAQSEGNEYLIEYLTNIKESGRLENAVGWYHSHPGYGCWLSGIDVTTQKLNQQFQDPFLAVVVDPVRSSSAGKVEIGAFRTYPAGYTPENQRETEFQAIPVEKIEDFGVHAGEYYPLSVEYFKSSQDEEIIAKLWDKYWMNILSTSTVFSNQDFFDKQIVNLKDEIKYRYNDNTFEHIKSFNSELEHITAYEKSLGIVEIKEGKEEKKEGSDNESKNKEEKIEGPLSKVIKESNKVNIEMTNALFNEAVKYALFGTLEQ